MLESVSADLRVRENSTSKTESCHDDTKVKLVMNLRNDPNHQIGSKKKFRRELILVNFPDFMMHHLEQEIQKMITSRRNEKEKHHHQITATATSKFQ